VLLQGRRCVYQRGGVEMAVILKDEVPNLSHFFAAGVER
jgi:hypothetical protein